MIPPLFAIRKRATLTLLHKHHGFLNGAWQVTGQEAIALVVAIGDHDSRAGSVVLNLSRTLGMEGFYVCFALLGQVGRMWRGGLSLECSSDPMPLTYGQNCQANGRSISYKWEVYVMQVGGTVCSSKSFEIGNGIGNFPKSIPRNYEAATSQKGRDGQGGRGLYE